MKKKQSFCLRIPLLLLVLFQVSGCTEKPKEVSKIEIKRYSKTALEYPEETTVISSETKADFLQNYFMPWTLSEEEVMASLASFPGKDLSYLQSYLSDDEWYGENKKPHKKFLREEIVSNVSKESFPNFLKKIG